MTGIGHRSAGGRRELPETLQTESVIAESEDRAPLVAEPAKERQRLLGKVGDTEKLTRELEQATARIAVLETEIARVRAKLQAAVNFRASADQLFRK